MNNNHYEQFAPAIRSFNGDSQASGLHMASEGRLDVFYAPFEWVNAAAKLIIVGITPGPDQAKIALAEARRQLLAGSSNETAIMHAKKAGGFSGDLRANLVAMLDRVGLPRWAHIDSSADLFASESNLLQTASVLPYPVYRDLKRYNGTPPIRRSPLLRSMVMERFVPMLRAIPDAKLIAVGDVPFDTLNWLAQEKILDPARILGCLPHPSGASNERIGYFLGKYSTGMVSKMTNAVKLDQMRKDLHGTLTRTVMA